MEVFFATASFLFVVFFVVFGVFLARRVRFRKAPMTGKDADSRTSHEPAVGSEAAMILRRIWPDDPQEPKVQKPVAVTEPAEMTSSAVSSEVRDPRPKPVMPVANDAILGGFTQFSIGDPGRTRSRIIPKFDPAFLDVPDTVLDGGVLLDAEGDAVLTLRAASVRGLSHRHYGNVRQDSYGFRVTADNRFIVLAVADGVSAGTRSHQAAALATEEIPRAVGEVLGSSNPSEIDWNQLIADSTVRVIMSGVRKMVIDGRLRQEDFGLSGIERDEFLEMIESPRLVGQLMATTVAIAVVSLSRNELGNHEVWFTRIGDTSGWIIRNDEDGSAHWHSLGSIKNEGETIAESATLALPFLPSEPLEVTHTELGHGEVFVLVTDGIGDPLGGGGGLTGEAFGSWWTKPPNPIEFAAQVDFDRVTFDDDRTAIALWLMGD